MNAPPVVVLVDGSNVARCGAWLRLLPGEDDHQRRVALVDRASSWAAREGVDLTLVFDGAGPWGAGPVTLSTTVEVIGSGGADGDALVERRAASLRAASRAYWLVTSDGVLRHVAGGAAQRTITADDFAALVSGDSARAAGESGAHTDRAAPTRTVAAELDDDVRVRLERMRRGE